MNRCIVGRKNAKRGGKVVTLFFRRTFSCREILALADLRAPLWWKDTPNAPGVSSLFISRSFSFREIFCRCDKSAHDGSEKCLKRWETRNISPVVEKSEPAVIYSCNLRRKNAKPENAKNAIYSSLSQIFWWVFSFREILSCNDKSPQFG